VYFSFSFFLLFFLEPLTFAWIALSGFQSTRNISSFACPLFLPGSPFRDFNPPGRSFLSKSPFRVFSLASFSFLFFSSFFFFSNDYVHTVGIVYTWGDYWHMLLMIYESKIICLSFLLFFQRKHRNFWKNCQRFCFKYLTTKIEEKFVHRINKSSKWRGTCSNWFNRNDSRPKAWHHRLQNLENGN